MRPCRSCGNRPTRTSALFCNAFTFIAVPFEKLHRRRAAQGAGPSQLSDPDVAAEAEAFLRQEAQHAAAHRKHMLALDRAATRGSSSATNDACIAYDDLIDEQPIEFHAAYIANLEATFTPLFKVILDNRDSLFGGSDHRVASLMMWHFVEEIEHRSSGLLLCRHINARSVVPRQTHPRHVPPRRRHLSATVAKAFDEHIPFDDRGASAQERCRIGAAREFKYRVPGCTTRGSASRPAGVPRRARPASCSGWCGGWRSRRRLHHDPADQPLPDWADTWMREYERGTDMTTFLAPPGTEVNRLAVNKLRRFGPRR